MRDGFIEEERASMAYRDMVRTVYGSSKPAEADDLVTYWCVGHIATGRQPAGTLLWKGFGFVPNDIGLASDTVVGCVVPARLNDTEAVTKILEAEFGETFKLVFMSPKPLGFFPSCMEVN